MTNTFMTGNLASDRKVVHIDVVRAICIVLVVVGHYFPDGSPAWYTSFRDWIYSFHMHLFMYLSGYVYVLSNKNTPYIELLKKKVHRLLVPYFIVSIIIILIKLLGQKVLGTDLKNPVDAGTFLKIFIGPAAAVHLWFILALWWMFVIVPFFKSRLSHIYLLAAAVLLHYLPSIFPQIAYPEIFCLNYTANYFIFFMLGIVLCENGISLFRYPTAFSVAAVALFLLNYIFCIIPFANAYAGIFGMIGLSVIISKIRSKNIITWLQVVSDASYTIYLLHSIFIGFISSALKPFPQFIDPQGKWFFCSAFCIIFLSIVCCIAVWYVLYLAYKHRCNCTKKKSESPK